MAYVALYRKYRSQSFAEVVGQPHVTTVLQNALRTGRIAHAYLFCGPRGCGKTSTARLLARALNCQSSSGPTPEPCGECNMCKRIRDGSAMDVIEMDAASETGIDDVREKIIENARYSPAEARFKVYIIDEVHDLSQKAFDSLLKTIEEPPSHVVFILATTESHKVPITIRSRCQRMDFRRGTVGDLAANLERVVSAEGIACEPGVVAAIARAAEGSFRDSLSLLEQVLAYSDGAVTLDTVYSAIGSIGPAVLDEFAEMVASDDMQAALRFASKLVNSGRDVRQTLTACQAHLRDLLVALVSETADALPDVTAERFEQLRSQAKRFTPDAILRMLDVLAQAERDTRFTNQHRLLLEKAFWSVLPSRLAATAALAAPARTAPAPAPPSAPSPPKAAEPPQHTYRSASPRQHAVPEPVRGPAPAQSRHQPADDVPSPVPAANVAASHGKDSAPPKDPGIDLEGMRRIWPRVRDRIFRRSRSAAAIFGSEEVMSFDGHFVTLGFTTAFGVNRAGTEKGRHAVEEALAEELGFTGIKVRCQVIEDDVPPPSPDFEMPEPSLDLIVPEPVAPPISPAAAEGEQGESSEAATTADEEQFFTEVMTELDGTPVDE